MLERLQGLSPLALTTAAIDVAIVAYVFYRLLVLIRGTRAVQLIRGIAVLILAEAVSRWLRLYTINWLLKKVEMGLLFALPVVFQPELRRALDQLGRGQLFAPARGGIALLSPEDLERVIGEVVRAAETLANGKTGALMVIERQTGLKEVMETGTQLDALVSAEVLVNIFVPRTPLHDGAAIIRNDRVAAAGCFLPLAEGADLARELGTRHRAALGISEQSDALAIVVSEETGVISLANGGKLIRHLDASTLREMLTALCVPSREGGFGLWGRGGAAAS